jgi:transposase
MLQEAVVAGKGPTATGGVPVGTWASRRRRDLLELLDRLNPTIAALSQAIEQEVEKYPAAQRLITHPGVGALTALACVLIIGRAERFQCGKQIGSYLGLVPLEDSSGHRRRAGPYYQAGEFDLALLFCLVQLSHHGNLLTAGLVEHNGLVKLDVLLGHSPILQETAPNRHSGNGTAS